MAFWTEAKLAPKIVSRFVGIDPSSLPRLTTQTIGRATQPPRKRGGSGRYSGIDALLISLGVKLLNSGLLPGRCQICLQNVRVWISNILADKRIGTKAEPFVRVEARLCWLVGHPTNTGYTTAIYDGDGIAALMLSEQFAEPHLLLNLMAFLNQEGKRLKAMVEEMDETAMDQTASVA